jgi:hypothetical protein
MTNSELVELALKREIARLSEELKSLSSAEDRKQQLQGILTKRESQLARYQHEGRL